MQRGSRLWPVAVLAAGVGLTGWAFRPAPADAHPTAQPGAAMAAGVPKYTVVESEGVSLMVVDNARNTLYFYTCDEGKEAGEKLRLRGSIDLSQVGQPMIEPKGQPKADK